MYLENRHEDLDGKAAAILLKDRIAKLRVHVDAHYPQEVYGGSGGLSPELVAAVSASIARWKKRRVDSLIEDKNAVMPDAAKSLDTIFENVRPVAVLHERNMSGLANEEDQLAMVLKGQAMLSIKTGNQLEAQFLPQYPARMLLPQ